MAVRRKHSNSLLAALIEQLPADGPWPVEQQKAWLHMTAVAFGVCYGGNVAASLFAGSPVAAFKPAVPRNTCYISPEGAVLTAAGKPAMPSDIRGPIVDLRGPDGDISTIVWADGSTGTLGLDLTIGAS